MNGAGYVLSNRNLYFLINEIVKTGDPKVQLGILTGIIQGLKPEMYRDVLRAAVKAVYSSGDTSAARRMSKSIVSGTDYIFHQRRHEADMRELCG